MARRTHPLKALYRMIVMAGVLAVGSMAAYLYGPPPEQLAGMINDVAHQLDSEPMPVQAEGSEPLAFLDDQSTPPIVAIETNPAGPGTTTGQLVESIKAAGATDAKIESWGSSGEFYRASAELRVGAMTKQLDQVASTPEASAAALIAEIQQASFVR